ncbi:unnamed protein product, partial [Tuber aestivum]
LKIWFFSSNELQMSLFIVLLEGFLLSYRPPVRKSVSQPLDHFLIQPPPLCCNI